MIRRLLCCLCGLLALAAPFPAAGQPRDITAAVVARTQAAALLDGICQQFCLGSRREGRIKYVTAAPRPDGLLTIEAAVTLRSADDNPYLPFDRTVEVAGHGVLDPATCRFTVGMARVEQDVQGLFQELLRHYGFFVGWEYDVPDCRTVLAP